MIISIEIFRGLSILTQCSSDRTPIFSPKTENGSDFYFILFRRRTFLSPPSSLCLLSFSSLWNLSRGCPSSSIILAIHHFEGYSVVKFQIYYSWHLSEFYGGFEEIVNINDTIIKGLKRNLWYSIQTCNWFSFLQSLHNNLLRFFYINSKAHVGQQFWN